MVETDKQILLQKKRTECTAIIDVVNFAQFGGFPCIPVCVSNNSPNLAKIAGSVRYPGGKTNRHIS